MKYVDGGEVDVQELRKRVKEMEVGMCLCCHAQDIRDASMVIVNECVDGQKEAANLREQVVWFGECDNAQRSAEER